MVKCIKFRIPTKSSYFSSDIITHMQMADEIVDYANKWGRKIGAGIFDNDFKITNRIIMSVMSLMTFTCIINLYDIFLFRNDMVRCVFCLLTFSADVQGFIKFYTFLWLRENILDLKKQSEKFHEHFASVKSSNKFEDQFMIAAHVSAGLTILYVCTFILIVIYPIIFYLIMNKRILHFGIELPLIDWEYSWIGYGINFIHQVMLTFAFFCASLCSLYIIICFMTSAIGQFDVLEILLDELNDLAIGNEDGKKDDEISTKIKFLIQTHANLIEFLHELRQTFASYYFIELAALVFQKTVEIFAIISLNFIPGYLCAVITGFQLFLPCALGSMLVSKGEQFYDDLCNFSWNLVSISDQKALKFILQYSRKPKGLSAGFVALNFYTFLQIYKTVYSYLVLLDCFKS
ncbi:putative odorant receptor 83c [Chironomus tepperi]|uniref:putative odorant receptor 83c n=1 Tax=Chironomus tepperi TaxID=113505 RepID=UPI00391F1AD8